MTDVRRSPLPRFLRSRPTAAPAPRRRWALRALPVRAQVLLLLVEVLALALALPSVLLTTPAALLSTAPVALALGLAAIVHTECALGVERARHRLEATPHADLTTVWTFAGALLLPAPAAALLVVLVYLHLHLRAWRPIGVSPYRVIFSTATLVLSVLAAEAVVRLVGGGPLAALPALGAYLVVNLGLVVLAIRLSAPGTTLAAAVGHRDELLLEGATLAMGAVVAAVVAAGGPEYVLLALPPLVVLHRTVLVRQLAAAAVTDAKTGLLTAAEWTRRSSILLRRARLEGHHAAVLLLDLDHFKEVNDSLGHLAGDTVLAEVAGVLRAEVREGDLVGRFGGEEFVVLLSGAGSQDLEVGALVAADRIRDRVARLRPAVASGGTARVTLSAGVATAPRDGHDLDRLIAVADTALYAAKAAGRDAVRGRPAPRPLEVREA